MEPMFCPANRFSEDELYSILFDSYANVLYQDAGNTERYIGYWKQFVRNVSSNPKIAECVRVSVIDTTPIGLCSYDPRQFPDIGIIGQNCILPQYKRQGFGSSQIEHVLHIFTASKCKKAFVETGGIDFFPSSTTYVQKIRVS